MKKYYSQALIVIATVMWGIISLFSKPLSIMGFSPMQILFMRALLSAFFLGIYICFKDKSLFKINLKDLPIFICAGVCGFSFCVFCYMGSINQNGAGIACTLMYTSPVWTAIISRIVFNEKMSLQTVVALILVLLGCFLACFSVENEITRFGFILGLSSGLGLSLVGIFSKLLANKNYSAVAIQFYVFLFSALASLPFAKIGELPCMIKTDYDCLVYFIHIALVCTVIPYVLYSVALKNVSASTAGIISTLEVVSSIIIGVLAFNDKISVIRIIGILLMLVSIFLLSLNNKKSKTR